MRRQQREMSYPSCGRPVYLNVFFDFLLATTDLLERCFCYLCDVFGSSCFYLSMSKCKLQTVDLFHGYIEFAFQN